jgi:hypothetical protein
MWVITEVVEYIAVEATHIWTVGTSSAKWPTLERRKGEGVGGHLERIRPIFVFEGSYAIYKLHQWLLGDSKLGTLPGFMGGGGGIEGVPTGGMVMRELHHTTYASYQCMLGCSTSRGGGWQGLIYILYTLYTHTTLPCDEFPSGLHKHPAPPLPPHP